MGSVVRWLAMIHRERIDWYLWIVNWMCIFQRRPNSGSG